MERKKSNDSKYSCIEKMTKIERGKQSRYFTDHSHWIGRPDASAAAGTAYGLNAGVGADDVADGAGAVGAAGVAGVGGVGGSEDVGMLVGLVVL